jgi:hypothetical protein
MKRLVILVLALAWVAGSTSEAPAQKKAKEKEAEMHAKTLKEAKDAKKRQAAADGLYAIAEVKASYVRPHTTVLVDAYKGDSDAGVRVTCANTLMVCEPDPKTVVPVALDIIKNLKEPNTVLAATARLLAAFPKDSQDGIPALQELKKREEAKEDPKLRDQQLLQAVNAALQRLAK